MSDTEGEGTQLQSFTIDQAAGALALSLGALGSLLLVIWQSRCMCRCRIGCSDTCYIFDCMRQPPPDEENPDDKKKDNKKDKKDKVGRTKGNSEQASQETRPLEENPDDKKGLKKNTPASGAKTNLKTPTPPEDEGLIPDITAPIADDNQSAVI